MAQKKSPEKRFPASKKTVKSAIVSSKKTVGKAGRPATNKKKSTKKKTTSRADRMTVKKPVMVIAGEHSGDWLGADLIRALKKRGYDSFFGTGGPSMQAEGAELIETVESMNVIGFVEAFRAYRRLKALAEKLADMALEKDVSCAVLIDYPGFNLRIAEMLKKRGIAVCYLVSPQIWAWNYRRIKTIRKNIDLMLTLFPFEEDMYRAESVRAYCVGHPLVHRLPRQLKSEEPIRSFSGKTIGLLPGSRNSEIRRLLIPMLEAARNLQADYKRIRFLIPGINPHAENYIKDILARYSDLNVEYIEGRSLRVMESSDLVILSSGTATMETAYFQKPMIILYKVGLLNFLLGSAVLRTRFLGMVNLLAHYQVAPELIQREVRSEVIYEYAKQFLSDKTYYDKTVEELDAVKKSLGKGNPAEKAADHIVRVFEEGL